MSGLSIIAHFHCNATHSLRSHSYWIWCAADFKGGRSSGKPVTYWIIDLLTGRGEASFILDDERRKGGEGGIEVRARLLGASPSKQLSRRRRRRRGGCETMVALLCLFLSWCPGARPGPTPAGTLPSAPLTQLHRTSDSQTITITTMPGAQRKNNNAPLLHSNHHNTSQSQTITMTVCHTQ